MVTEQCLFAADSVGVNRGGRVVLRSASVWIRAGHITVLLGRNGSGKSTLIRAAMGLAPPARGLVVFQDERTTRPRLSRLARGGLFYLPDRGLLSSAFTIREHLTAVATRFGGTYLREAIALAGVGDLLDRGPHSLSSGERRRAELAVVYARHPICLIADEPLVGLMPTDRERMLKGLMAMARAGCGVLLTGHDTEDLLGVADDVVWLTAGTTHHLGGVAQARAHDQFRREYLGVR